MGNIVPRSASEILERTLDTVRSNATADGVCFGGDIMAALREAGKALGINHQDLLVSRTILVRTMESLGERYPAEVLQDFETPMPLSRAFNYLNEAIAWTARLKGSQGGQTDVSRE